MIRSQSGSRRWIPALAVSVILVVLGVLVQQFLAGDRKRIEADPARTAAAESQPAIAKATASDTTAPDATPTRSAEAIVVPPPEPPAAAPLPESYRRALSGVKGRLVEEDGKPVAGLKVELMELLGSALLGDFEHAFLSEPAGVPELVLDGGVSDEKGIFELHGALGAAFHGLGVDLGGARGTLRFVDRTLNSGEVTDLGDVVLSAFVTWKGSVVDEDGNPIPGARVRATLLPPLVFQPGVADVGRLAAMMEVRTWGEARTEVYDVPASVKAWESKLPFPTTTTKEDGTFELAGVPQGLACLVADRDGFVGNFKGPMPTGKRDKEVGKVVLSRGRAVSGAVVDADGRPLAGAQVVAGVVIDVANLAIAFPAAAPTDADGRFTVDHLSEQGSAIKVAARARVGDRWVVETSDDGGPVTITLPVGFTVDVKLAVTGGALLPDADLSLRPSEGPPFLTWAPPIALAADRVVKVADGELRILGLIPGAYQLTGRAPGYGLAQIAIDVKDSPVAATLEFTPARELAVHVFDRDTKQPIEHAEVSATLDGRMTPPLVARRTDALGAATLKGLPQKPLRIRAFHPAYAPTAQLLELGSLPPDAARIDLVLGPGATLHGRIHHGGQPLLEPMLFLLDERHEGHNIDDEVPRFAVPGLDGTFTLRGLKPGSARWQVFQRLFAGEPQQALQNVMGLARADGNTRRGTVDLVEGETTEVDVDIDPAAAGKPGRITGILRVKGGSADFRVRTMTNAGYGEGERAEKTTDVHANQHFTIEPVGPGFVNVSIERVRPEAADGRQFRGSALHQEWFQLEGGGERVIEIDFDFADEEVHVVDADGQPVAGQVVEFQWVEKTAEGAMNQHSVWASTGPDGVAHAELPRPGHYTVKCMSPQKGRAAVEADLPSREPIALALDPGVPCAGRIEFDPEPAAGGDMWFCVVQLRDGNVSDAGGWNQLKDDQRTFDVKGLAPGKYQGQIYASNKVATVDFELGRNGDDRLVLRFKLK